MPKSNAKKLTIAVSSRAIFDLEQGNKIFEEQGPEAFKQYQRDHVNDIPELGCAYNLISKLLQFNNLNGERLVEVLVLSRNDPLTGKRIWTALDHYGCDVHIGVFTQGEPIHRYLRPLHVDLFLSAHQEDVDNAISSGTAAAKVFQAKDTEVQKNAQSINHNQLRFAFDGDAVLFDSKHEQVYHEQGLAKFNQQEKKLQDTPMEKGPFLPFLQLLADLRKRSIGVENAPQMRIALVTARGHPAQSRAINTLASWGLEVDEAFFLAGHDKSGVLEAFAPDIFFDDLTENCNLASERKVPAAQVPRAKSKVSGTKKFKPLSKRKLTKSNS